MNKSEVIKDRNMKSISIIKHKILISGLIILIVILFFTTLILAQERDDLETLLTINEEKITVSEFMLNYDKDKEKAIGKLIDNRAKLNILKEYKIIENTEYKDILSELKLENKRRKEEKENNKIIYGPVQYSAKQYYEYILSNGQAELEFIIEDKFKEEINNKIKLIYEENKENFRIEDAVECEIISINFVDEEGSIHEIEKQKAKELAEKIKANINNDSETFKKVYKETYEFKYENKALDENYRSEIKEKALELEVGEVSEVIEFNGSYHILKCLNRYNQGYEDLDKVKDQIFVEEINKIIDELMKKEKENMRIEIREEVLDKIK